MPRLKIISEKELAFYAPRENEAAYFKEVLKLIDEVMPKDVELSFYEGALWALMQAHASSPIIGMYGASPILSSLCVSVAAVIERELKKDTSDERTDEEKEFEEALRNFEIDLKEV